MLRLWGQPDYLCRLGLFHSAYSNSYVNLAIFDAASDRPLVADAIGADAERLTHKLCIVPRHDIVWDELAESGRVPEEGLTTRHIRTGEDVHLSRAELRHLLVFTMADISEQVRACAMCACVCHVCVCPCVRACVCACTVRARSAVHSHVAARRTLCARARARLTRATPQPRNPARARARGASCAGLCAPQYAGWYDEVFDYPRGGAIFAPGASRTTQGHRPGALWPGACKPGLWVSHVGRLALAARSAGAEVEGAPLPPVFDGCSRTLTPEAELRARDLYVSVVNDTAVTDSPSSRAAAVDALTDASELNPFVGEPLTVLAQCRLADGRFEEAERAAAAALELHAMWGTSWDKRMRWAGWVAWTRVLLGRAREREPWPQSSWAAVNLGLVR